MGLVDQIVGVTNKDPAYPFPVMGAMVRYPASAVTPPVGTDPIAWIKGLKPSSLDDRPETGLVQVGLCSRTTRRLSSMAWRTRR